MELYVVSYDISVNKIRQKLAKLLEGYGTRVQYSVFECNLSLSDYKKLKREIIKILLGHEEESVRIYYVCRCCKDKMVLLGNEKTQEISSDNSVIVV